MPIAVEREGVRPLAALRACRPFIAAPSTHIHFVVNGRPVRDKLLLGAVRGAYADVMAVGPPSGRSPSSSISTRGASTSTCIRRRRNCASAIRRFVRALVVGGAQGGDRRAGFRAATTGGTRTLDDLRPATGALPRPSSSPAARGPPPCLGVRQLAGAARRRPPMLARLRRGQASLEHAALRRRSRLRPIRRTSRRPSAPPAPRSTAPTSSRRRRTASSSSTSTRRMSASSTSA